MLLCSIAHCIICKRLFRGKTHSDWFDGIEILQGRWQHGEKVGYCYPSGLEKTLCKWDIYVPLVTKGLTILWILFLLYEATDLSPFFNLHYKIKFNRFSLHIHIHIVVRKDLRYTLYSRLLQYADHFPARDTTFSGSNIPLAFILTIKAILIHTIQLYT